jgi:fermentation-respiration switch protein FrsA (DUF1100 family)
VLRNRLGTDRVGLLGSGGSGGALALYAAAVDDKVAAVAAISAYADGTDWLRSMRTSEEWSGFCDAVTANRRAMALGAKEAQVDPIDGVIRRASVRSQTQFKADIAHELPLTVGLSVVDSITAMNPVDIMYRIGPRPVHLFAAASDIPVPYDHARRLFEAAVAPKVLWTLRDTDGYRLHATHGPLVADRLAWWFGSVLSVGTAPKAETAADTSVSAEEDVA